MTTCSFSPIRTAELLCSPVKSCTDKAINSVIWLGRTVYQLAAAVVCTLVRQVLALANYIFSLFYKSPQAPQSVNQLEESIRSASPNERIVLLPSIESSGQPSITGARPRLSRGATSIVPRIVPRSDVSLKLEQPSLLAGENEPILPLPSSRSISLPTPRESLVPSGELPFSWEAFFNEGGIERLLAQKEQALTEGERQGAHCILSTLGFTADPFDQLTKYGFKGEVQGTALLRSQTTAETRKHVQAISLPALKSQKEANLEQYLTFSLKRFGHACHLEGTVDLPTGKNVNLEGFCEAFTIPMIAASFEDFAKIDPFFDEDSQRWIVEAMNQTTSSDSISDREIEAIAARIQASEFIGPISIGAGYDWHATGAIFFGDYLMYCNRGAGSGTQPGIHLFRIPDRSLVTKEVIRQLSRRQEVTSAQHFNCSDIERELGGVRIHYENLPSQETGNCTYVSMQTALFSLMTIKHLLNFFGNDPSCLREFIDEEVWQQSFTFINAYHRKWVRFDERMVTTNFLLETRSLLERPVSSLNEALIHTYQSALQAWQTKHRFSSGYSQLNGEIEELQQQLRELKSRLRNNPPDIFSRIDLETRYLTPAIETY
ncbi:hypothetical protein [Candidatus Protochlamydia phocaeensis]|uniref:hypothetical protein n=1 Tax=Candidatus Protochlamydia phocaeensis TaxID=1414722 RepID=UPI000837F5A1|nr:hypothetical protein [Candidatus Protochlamydia phocaeensis]